ncbi:chloride channel protein, CIC family [Bryocella elongata]|uniref:Chloride channel protein, CIC family n=1 Tax=Bryocella elongata TaxID=863522 RepID=A0A1H6ANN6_9BACT|nr:chloride channel protein [Bryocella elongata]SEG49386.1 chloride channel protein, CIC family [Bryocella elongata]
MTAKLRRYPLVSRLMPLVREDLDNTYARDLHKWLLIAPLLGVTVGLTVTAVSEIILRRMWSPVLACFLAHPWTIVPIVTAGCGLAGVVMQLWTPNPNEHSTEEILHAYHHDEGRVDMRPFAAKLAAAALTVGLGGSAALEGPSIYSGGALGSWLWERLRRIKAFRLTDRDRRILLISGAAAGMSAVFRAPLTGIVFALEMPYKDDLAHEALLPSLLASVVSYVTLGSFLGGEPLFDFHSTGSYTMHDLWWCALLGALVGLAAMTFVISFRRLRFAVVKLKAPHALKLTVGGLLTGLTGLGFLRCYPGRLIPLGPNYEAVGMILDQSHGTRELLSFVAAKLGATAFTLGAGGVSAMFVPLFLSGGTLGVAFSQSFVHSSQPDLYAAVGMAAFLSAAYKTPLAAVVFVAEATGGHAFLIPALVGAAVAYIVSGDSSISPEQTVHERAEAPPPSSNPAGNPKP